MDMNRLRTNWIWLPNWIPEDDSDARIVYFRKEMMVDDALPAKKEIKITADSRYKLYINGKFVQEGPQKPLDQKKWFVDTANAAPYLVPGKNGWKCTINREIAIIGEAGRPAPIHAQENVYATEFFAG